MWLVNTHLTPRANAFAQSANIVTVITSCVQIRISNQYILQNQMRMANYLRMYSYEYERIHNKAWSRFENRIAIPQCRNNSDISDRRIKCRFWFIKPWAVYESNIQRPSSMNLMLGLTIAAVSSREHTWEGAASWSRFDSIEIRPGSDTSDCHYSHRSNTDSNPFILIYY